MVYINRCKKKDVIITWSLYTIRIEKEYVKTVATILVKTAILIRFVRNNVVLNIKWNMRENSEAFITCVYPILIPSIANDILI
jgi:hypothetical protein